MLAVAILCLTLVQAQPFPHNYKEVADKIIHASTSDSYVSFDHIEYMCDTFGPRFVGTQNLEDALNWVSQFLSTQGVKVTKEPVENITHWVRGKTLPLLFLTFQEMKA